ncbi:unnamed protein product [Amaranthus hypochondriacus]
MMKMIEKNIVSSILIISFVMLTTELMHGANGQIICGIPAIRFAPCLPSLRGPNPLPPSPICCNTIRSGNQKCLCSFVNSPLLPRYGISKALFLAIFPKCGLPSC